jgi:hypothetical protein
VANTPASQGGAPADNSAPSQAFVQAFGSPAAAAAAFSQVEPQAGSGQGDIPDTESDPLFRDSLADALAQPLQAGTPTQSDGKPLQSVTPLIGGLLVRLNPPNEQALPRGLTATGDDYSIWGNEAYW